MNKNEYNKKIARLGFLSISYSSLKIFDIYTAIVFARLNTEYNNAIKYNYLIDQHCFAFDAVEIAQATGLSVDEVEISINKLKNLDLIKTKKIERNNLLYLNIDNIVDYITMEEEKRNLKPWNLSLNQLQYTVYSEITLNTANQELLKDWQDEDYELATDENGNPLYFG
jgi:hypothetical protein